LKFDSNVQNFKEPTLNYLRCD